MAAARNWNNVQVRVVLYASSLAGDGVPAESGKLKLTVIWVSAERRQENGRNWPQRSAVDEH